jgi:hypothetical protein
MFRTFGSSVVVVILLTLLSSRTKADDLKLEGAIVRIEGEIVAVKGMDREQEMKMEPGTRITSGGKPVMVADLKVGQKVQCVFEKRGDKAVCMAMEIMRDTP